MPRSLRLEGRSDGAARRAAGRALRAAGPRLCSPSPEPPPPSPESECYIKSGVGTPRRAAPVAAAPARPRASRGAGQRVRGGAAGCSSRRARALFRACGGEGEGREGEGGWVGEVAHLLCWGARAKLVGSQRNMAGKRTCGSFSAAPAARSSGERRRVRIRWELLAVGETFLPGQARRGGLCTGRGSSLGVY